MAQTLKALAKAIQDRLRGDTTATVGLVALLAQGANGVHTDFPNPVADPPGTDYPCVVIDFNSGNVDDPLQTRRDEINFEIHIIAPKRSSSANYKGFTRVADILDRVVGNWDATGGGGVPTFGLQRYLPDFSGYTGEAATTATCETIWYTGWVNNTDPDSAHRVWVASFRVGIDKVAS